MWLLEATVLAKDNCHNPAGMLAVLPMKLLIFSINSR